MSDANVKLDEDDPRRAAPSPSIATRSDPFSIYETLRTMQIMDAEVRKVQDQGGAGGARCVNVPGTIAEYLDIEIGDQVDVWGSSEAVIILPEDSPLRVADGFQHPVNEGVYRCPHGCDFFGPEDAMNQHWEEDHSQLDHWTEVTNLDKFYIGQLTDDDVQAIASWA